MASIFIGFWASWAFSRSFKVQGFVSADGFKEGLGSSDWHVSLHRFVQELRASLTKGQFVSIIYIYIAITLAIMLKG